MPLDYRTLPFPGHSSSGQRFSAMTYAKHGNLEHTYPAESTYYLTEQIAIANRNGDSNSFFLLTLTCCIRRLKLVLRLCRQFNLWNLPSVPLDGIAF